MNYFNLFLSVSLLLLAGCKKKKTNAQRWPLEHVQSADTVFLGDSIIARWPRKDVLNHAVGGQWLETVADYVREDAGIYHPKRILIEGGLNDLHEGHSVKKVTRYAILALFKAYWGGARVIYLANMVDFDGSQESCRSFGAYQKQIDQVNAALPKLCKLTPGCRFFDIKAVVGAYTPELRLDCIHLNEKGYKLVDEAFERIR